MPSETGMPMEAPARQTPRDTEHAPSARSGKTYFFVFCAILSLVVTGALGLGVVPSGGARADRMARDRSELDATPEGRADLDPGARSRSSVERTTGERRRSTPSTPRLELPPPAAASHRGPR